MIFFIKSVDIKIQLGGGVRNFETIQRYIGSGVDKVILGSAAIKDWKFLEEACKKFPNQIVGVKDSSYNLFETLKIKNFSIFPGSEAKLLKGLELGCHGVITATTNVTGHLARKIYDNFHSNEE